LDSEEPIVKPTQRGRFLIFPVAAKAAELGIAILKGLPSLKVGGSNARPRFIWT